MLQNCPDSWWSYHPFCIHLHSHLADTYLTNSTFVKGGSNILAHKDMNGAVLGHL